MAVRFTDYFVGTQFHPERSCKFCPILEIRRPKKNERRGEKIQNYA
jgi:hypothetical protein